jgi:2-keto-3-deoxy-L-rhamnonate aldolase RhmA
MSLITGETQVGVFVKTASHQVIEVLGAAGLDFAVIDAEHAPFDRNALDVMLLAGRASRLALLVRVADASGQGISSALDMGAAGVVVPHVHSAAHAREIVANAKFRSGRRGVSPSPRYAGYGSLGMAKALEAGDATAVVCQIEDREGLSSVEEIAKVPGVSALFIGRADLAHALSSAHVSDPLVVDASLRIIEAARQAGKAAAIFLPDSTEKAFFEARGASMFIIGSDQSILRSGVSALKGY